MHLRQSRYPLGVLLAIGLAIGLTACGPNPTPSVPQSIVITAPSIPIGTLVAGCSASELEAWYEVAGSLSDRFAIESIAALDQPPDAMAPILGRQAKLLDRIMAEPVPECAGETHTAIVQRLAAIRAAFEAYYEMQIDASQLRERVNAEHTVLTTEVAARLSDLAAGMDELYYLATQTAVPAN